MKMIHHAGLFLCLSALLGFSWWMAGDHDRPESVDRLAELSRTKGPVADILCGPSGKPLAPPPIESPYGIHLYATSAKGVVHPLPAMEIVDALPVPEGTKAPADAPSVQAAKNDTAFDDVQTVTMLLEEFRRAFGAMPTGELNDEIVRRLQGENPKGIAVLPKNHPSISPDGELLDRFGTPFRFHPESAWHMTVRSAGPDKEMWTSDDIISEQTTPQDSPLTSQL